MEKPNLLDRLTAASDKISANKYLQGISQGVMTALPFIIVGAFGSLFLGLPIQPWQDFIAATGLSGCLNMAVNATANMLGVIITYTATRCFAEKFEVDCKIIGFFGVMFYLTLLPSAATEDGTAYLAYDYLGTKGMLLGLLLALVTVKMYKFITDKNITIKMPEGTPPFVANSFVALIPAFLIMLVAIIVRLIFSLTPFGSAFDLIYVVLQTPLNALVGNNIWSEAIIMAISNLVFAFGIHPGFITGLLAPILFGLDGMNQAAYAAGEAIPNTIGMAFNYITTIAVVYPAMAIPLLVLCKSKQLKTVGKISVAPAFFGISEPLVFGLPVVFNPVMMIPWIFVPSINMILGYFAMSSGLVAKCIGVTVFNVPMVFTGLMNGSISIAVMEVVLFLLDCLMFAPFILAQDRKCLKEEQEAAKSE